MAKLFSVVYSMNYKVFHSNCYEHVILGPKLAPMTVPSNSFGWFFPWPWAAPSHTWAWSTLTWRLERDPLYISRCLSVSSVSFCWSFLSVLCPENSGGGVYLDSKLFPHWGRLPGSTMGFLFCALSWTFYQCSKLRQSYSLPRFLSLKDHYSLLPDIQCFENSYFIYSVKVLVCSGGRVNLVPLTPSWPEMEVLVLMFYSLQV